MTVFHAVLVIHIAAGTLAVVSGIVPLVVAKPFSASEGQRHRTWGRVFATTMKVVIGSAIVLTILRPNAYFAGLAALAGLVAFSGIRVLRRKRPDIDSRQRATSIDWIVTLLCLAVGVFLFAGGRHTVVVRAVVYGTVGYAIYDIWRFLAPARFPFSPHLWLYEHLVKMIGAYFAAVAAFSGRPGHGSNFLDQQRGLDLGAACWDLWATPLPPAKMPPTRS